MELRQQIIEVASELFNTKGLKFTLDDICERMHISKKTIYVCFSCKEELLLEMTDAAFAAIYQRKKNILSEDLPFYEKLKKVMIILPDKMMNTDFRQLEGIKEKYPEVYERVRHYLEAGWEPVIELLDEGVKKHYLKKVEIPILKTMVASSISSFINDGLLEENDISYADALDSMVNIIINGIKENDYDSFEQ
ncbi:MAG: TetR/AcrR family transcriptional regulator [Erysipelotrichaceae bacterium]|nr:TetR/AcrR family transcriptional regulator [Erysipelotrichaceae bacterium]